MKTTQEWMAETMQPILDRIAGGPMTAEEERYARERMALIDAAPDLLKALESVLDALGALGNRSELNNRLSTNECKQVWAAYDKAKGETK